MGITKKAGYLHLPELNLLAIYPAEKLLLSFSANEEYPDLLLWKSTIPKAYFHWVIGFGIKDLCKLAPGFILCYRS